MLWRREEDILPLLTEEGNGKEVVEEPQKLILKPLPLGSLLVALSPNLMHILPTPAAHETPETPTIKATPIALPVQNFRKLSGFCSNLRHYIKDDDNYSYCMAQRMVQMLVQMWSTWTSAFLQLHQFQQPPKA